MLTFGLLTLMLTDCSCSIVSVKNQTFQINYIQSSPNGMATNLRKYEALTTNKSKTFLT